MTKLLSKMRNKSTLCICATIGLFIFVGGCQKDDAILVTEEPYSFFSVSDQDLYFKNTDEAKSFYIINEGNTTLDWSLLLNSDFLNTTPASGEIVAGDSVEVHVKVNRNSLEDKEYNNFIEINGGGQSQAISISLINFTETKWLIPYQIVDAEYDETNDRIIAVTTSPYKLIVIDPTLKSLQELDTKIPATCVSVSPDGRYAAVGHKGVVTYVSLEEMKVKKTTGLTFDVFDLVLTSNQRLHIFPAEGQHIELYTIDMNTGKEFRSWETIYEKTRGSLHPSEKFIYGATTNISPSYFEKYDVSGHGATHYMYDSPYHGDYEFGGNLWISEDGNYIFARSRNIFRSSNDQANDLTFLKELEGEGLIDCLDHSIEKNLTFAAFSEPNYLPTPSTGIRKYDKDFNLTATFSLPKFLVTNHQEHQEIRESVAKFGFFNRDGTQFYVIAYPSPLPQNTINKSALVTVGVD